MRKPHPLHPNRGPALPSRRALWAQTALVLVCWTMSAFSAVAYTDWKSLNDSVTTAQKRVGKQRKELKEIESELERERERLISQIEIMLATYPLSRYNDQILIRLAELYFEKSVQAFEERLARYERDLERFEKKQIKAPPDFPEYDFSRTSKIYNRILRDFPESPISDDAMYYLALCVEKQEGPRRAIQYHKRLIDLFPYSEFRVESYMKIAGYYFDNPREVGNGYEKAAAIYKKVLAYRENRNFVEALYRLGWCYYMQDRYPEAISVFKYLIEEVDLKFDLREGDQTGQNPLLRAEAIDYIAISFLESGGLGDALNFLKLVGNRNYAAKVLVRFGQLLEEQNDFAAARNAYRALLETYPLSMDAPQAHLALVRALQRLEDKKGAQQLRSEFFDRFSKGSEWAKANAGMPGLDKVNDMAVNTLLSVCENLLAGAKASRDPALYRQAVGHYQRLIDVYPENPGTYEAHWNMAVVLDQNVGDAAKAMRAYLEICQVYPKHDAHRKEAAINAIAMSQKILAAQPGIPESLMTAKKLEPRAEDVVKACENFLKFFPKDDELSRILFVLASTYYNRGLFKDAMKHFKAILVIKPRAKEFEPSMQFVAQSYSGLEDYMNAAAWYEKLMEIAKSKSVREDAKKRLIESRYRLAELAQKNGKLDRAMDLYSDIAEKFPKSEFAPIVLFSAAEAGEKLGKWSEAATHYLKLAKNYPSSKYSAGALFNGALALEKAEDFERAAEVYERLVAKYPKSDKAKDALYNAGLCYEKLGKLDKMAETNERFVAMFPDAEDVERMLFESAKYYKQSGKLSRSLSVFARYCKNYPGSPREVEAYYLSGSMRMEMRKPGLAEMEWQKAVDAHARQKAAGAKGNDYYAAEALFALAKSKEDRYRSLSMKGSGKKGLEAQKAKSKALQEAAAKFQSVADYRTVRIFQATYRIGSLYEDFAVNFWKRKTKKIDNPLKRIVADKQKAEAVAQLLSKAVVPYQTTLKLARETTDSIPPEARQAIENSKTHLAQVLYRVGAFYLQAGVLLQKSPTPKQIKKNILQATLYRSKLTQTAYPLKKKALQAWQDARTRLKAAGIDNEWSTKVTESLSKTNFERGNDFEKMSIRILDRPPLPEDMDEDEREEISFQLEDIAYDLQDLALAQYKEALALAQAENLNDDWSRQISERLAVLDPETYGKRANMVPYLLETDLTWKAASDSSPGWTSDDYNDQAWPLARNGSLQGELTFSQGSPSPIWGPRGFATVFFRKTFFVPGKPVSAQVFITADDNYRLFMNGTYVARDDTLDQDWVEIRNYDVLSILKGGRNTIAALAHNTDMQGNALVALVSAKIDTSHHFEGAPAIASAALTPGQPSAPMPGEAPPGAQAQSQPEQQSSPGASAAPAAPPQRPGAPVPPGGPKAPPPATPHPPAAQVPGRSEQPVPKQPASAQAKPARQAEPPKAVEKKPVAAKKPKAPIQTDMTAKEVQDEILTLQIRAKRRKMYIKREQVRLQNLNYQINYYDLRMKNLQKQVDALRSRLENKRRSR